MISHCALNDTLMKYIYIYKHIQSCSFSQAVKYLWSVWMSSFFSKVSAVLYCICISGFYLVYVNIYIFVQQLFLRERKQILDSWALFHIVYVLGSMLWLQYFFVQFWRNSVCSHGLHHSGGKSLLSTFTITFLRQNFGKLYIWHISRWTIRSHSQQIKHRNVELGHGILINSFSHFSCTDYQ